jgi:hypothetical protein
VQGLQRQDLEDQQVECALDEVWRFAHLGFLDEDTETALGKQGEEKRKDEREERKDEGGSRKAEYGRDEGGRKTDG